MNKLDPFCARENCENFCIVEDGVTAYACIHRGTRYGSIDSRIHNNTIPSFCPKINCKESKHE